MTFATFIKRSSRAIAAVLAAGLLGAASPALAGEFESLLKGRVILATDGYLSAKLKLSPMSKATANVGGAWTATGYWWPRPDGRVCVNFKSLWEGGNCGYIRKTGDAYTLTLGAWTQPAWRDEVRPLRRNTYPAPQDPPQAYKLQRKSLVGTTVWIDGQYAPLTITFNADATFDYASDDGLAFKGHWWVRDDGNLCLVSRTLFRIGACFEARGAAGKLEYFVTANEWRNWFKAEFRAR